MLSKKQALEHQTVYSTIIVKKNVCVCMQKNLDALKKIIKHTILSITPKKSFYCFKDGKVF